MAEQVKDLGQRQGWTLDTCGRKLVLHGVKDFHIDRGDMLAARHFSLQQRLKSELGLGPNPFFNPAMESCVIFHRTEPGSLVRRLAAPTQSRSTPLNTLPRLAPFTLLLAALILQACGDQSTEQATDRPGDLMVTPATPEQIEKLDQVVARFPQIKPLADQALADGTVTEQEIIEVFTAAEKVKNAKSAN